MSTNEALKLVVAADEIGAALCRLIKTDLESKPVIRLVADWIDPVQFGGHRWRYPDLAVKAARRIATGEADRAVLVCGTGLGMAISANRVPGVRAVTAHDSYSVERSVKSNDAQILCLGALVIGPALARRLVREWLEYRFDPASHSAANLAALAAYDQVAAATRVLVNGNGRAES
ncbi:MAG: RpiB/LacA/LacB family sugar-phosphate isomerase [Bifidobacteriaceae bacterium]|jgi:ribose 5-phosphate isomerase B|nr:RpiB/LacA/LacB family sugar-phosphate isomerase [Bifidobacteriaceae bacterium]